MFKNWFKNLDKILFLWLACFVINIITFLLIRYKIHPGNKILALHYNVVVGVDWYGAGKNLYSIPLIGFVISLVNLVLAQGLRSKLLLLSLLAPMISFMVGIILLVAVFFLSGVN